MMMGKGNPFFGKQHSDETKNAIRLKKLNGKKIPAKEEFALIYRSKKNYETASYFGINRVTVDRWRKRFGIPCKRNKTDMAADRGGGLGSTGV